MSLPWVRLDSNIGTHDKVTALLSDKDGPKALALYVCALGWSGGHGTDGHIPRHMLPIIVPGAKVTDRHAVLLVEHRLWEYAPDGWSIRNYALRQELEVVSAAKREAARVGGRKSQCVQRHGPDCGCWRLDDRK